ncbi:hypothetical protein D3C79_1003240 [compost metagenome]
MCNALAFRSQGDLVRPELQRGYGLVEVQALRHDQAQPGSVQFVVIGYQRQRLGELCKCCRLQGRFSGGLSFRFFLGECLSGFAPL